MELFKRITDLLTPPPAPKAAKPRAVPLVDPGPDLATCIRPHLRQLASAESLSDPEARESLAELKQLAIKKGLYVTAFEVKNQLDLLPRMNDKGAPYQRSRGYVLAADFFLGHVRQQIEGMKNQTRAVGPNVFRGYCNEMVGCLLHGENPRRAVEIPVLVIEELLSSAVDYSDRGNVFVELAGQAIASSLELARDNLNLQLGRAGSRFSSNPFGSDPGSRGDSSRLDESSVRYLADLQRKLGEVRDAIEKCLPLSPGTNRMGFLQTVLRASEPAGLVPFTAVLCERIGLLLEGAKSDEAMQYFDSAGERFEAQGDDERDLRLTKLAAARYRKAVELYQRANASQHAANAQAKLAELTAPKLQ
ncbi:MAG: hypothetical protein HZB26_19670 [Candidatus Hydrogenedentes bacterium]|nr:hypothetical protein [Candidatus Hydrogenedentota bacterium]